MSLVEHLVVPWKHMHSIVHPSNPPNLDRVSPWKLMENQQKNAMWNGCGSIWGIKPTNSEFMFLNLFLANFHHTFYTCFSPKQTEVVTDQGLGPGQHMKETDPKFLRYQKRQQTTNIMRCLVRFATQTCFLQLWPFTS